MKKFSVIVFAYFIAFNLAWSQASNPAVVANKMNQMLDPNATLPVFDLRYDGIKGTRFFIDEYLEGELWMSNNRHFTKELKYKFDEAANSVQVKSEADGKEVLLYNHEVEIFKLFVNGKTVTYFKAEVPGERDLHRLFQVIYFGRQIKLIKLPGKKLTYVKAAMPYTNDKNYDKLDDNHRYFIQIGSKKFEEISLKKKSFLKALSSKRAILEKLFGAPENKGDLDDVKIAAILQTIDGADNEIK